MQNIGKVDVALLPIGGRGFTMDMDDAIKAIEIINPKNVIPMHRFKADTKEFKRKAENRTSSRWCL
jgi:L-ascorbate metabolism protein UlaG (beta-lactamase superfamily)